MRVGEAAINELAQRAINAVNAAPFHINAIAAYVAATDALHVSAEHPAFNDEIALTDDDAPARIQRFIDSIK